MKGAAECCVNWSPAVCPLISDLHAAGNTHVN